MFVYRLLNYYSILLFLLILPLISGCNRSAQSTDDSARLIITSPEIAETVVYLRGIDNIVGVTIECDYPPELIKVDKIGSFGKVDIEKIVSLKPTIVFTSGLEQNRITSDLSKLGIKTAQIYPASFAEFLDSIDLIGHLLEVETEAGELRKKIEAEIAILDERQDIQGPKVYVEIYNNPLMSVSDSSFVGELIEIAGGNNIFKSLPRDYSRINPEAVIEADPEIMIVTYPGITVGQIVDRKGWDTVSAIRNRRIYTPEDLDPDLIVRASPRIIEGIRKLKEIILEN